ncbi:hypothetical protein O0I10_004380 [Lichtheimia ornata]|uniref:Uncharacterized protein n=1 Tax=Lichtheimia ornata TaxID=688661 RepID=A0AAD7V678_9FUNG|nr:uncharacterized protein O0I10_004380 [Lichtheimia ornata]KAJ8659787.1 hypothetical protein O0I10_004380 [Lichtheimia ornata]
MLPSISNLLNDTRPTPPPALNFVPPSPTPPTPPLVQSAFSPSSFPSPSFMPSPIESCASMSPNLPPAMSMDEYELPPLQGHDPPLSPLRRVSSAGEPEAAPWSIKDTLSTMNSAPLSLEQPKPRRGRPRSISNTSTESASSTTRGSSSYPMFMQENDNSSSLTFLTPTTWNVPATSLQRKAPSSSGKRNQNEVQAPRKKRGRKPKTVLAGHSCFVLPSDLQKKLQKP